MRTAILLFGLLLACHARSISITGVYVPPGGDFYGVSAQSGPVDLLPSVEDATEAWNSLIADDWSLSIRYGWSDSIGGALAQYTGWWFPFGDGRHFQARILFNPNFQWHVGDGPVSGFDLLTVATHEVGHSMIGMGPRWVAEIADGDVDITAPRRLAGGSFSASQEHLTDPSSLMYPTLSPGVRKGITATDLDVAMQVSGFEVYAVPEPLGVFVICLGFVLLAWRRR